MSRILIALMSVALFTGTAYAGAQQEKMKQCNAQAAGKKGDERKAFMKDCLSAKKTEEVSAKTAQQDKMKSCNQEAGEKNLKGAERKTFMSECLKK